jgi:hypothetical protein
VVAAVNPEGRAPKLKSGHTWIKRIGGGGPFGNVVLTTCNGATAELASRLLTHIQWLGSKQRTKELVMVFNGVEILKLQFSRAIDQTFEHFLDSWSLAPISAEGGGQGYPDNGQLSAEIPVFDAN